MTDTYSFSIKKGEDYEQELLIRESQTHDPIDIANMEFAASCRDHVHSEMKLFDFVFTKAADTSTGVVVMSVSRDITTALLPSAGAYDMFVTYTDSGLREPYMQGKITFEPEITEFEVSSTPVTYNMTIGDDQVSKAGFALKSGTVDAYGDLSPSAFYGDPVQFIVTDNPTNEVGVAFTTGQLTGITDIILAGPNSLLPPLTLTWNTTDFDYSAISAEWSNYILTNDTLTIVVTLEISSG